MVYIFPYRGMWGLFLLLKLLESLRSIHTSLSILEPNCFSSGPNWELNWNLLKINLRVYTTTNSSRHDCQVSHLEGRKLHDFFCPLIFRKPPNLLRETTPFSFPNTKKEFAQHKAPTLLPKILENRHFLIHINNPPWKLDDWERESEWKPHIHQSQYHTQKERKTHVSLSQRKKKEKRSSLLSLSLPLKKNPCEGLNLTYEKIYLEVCWCCFFKYFIFTNILK